MELQASFFSALITGVLTSVITKYDYIQHEGDYSELDMLQCQLRGHMNSSSCGIRLNTTTCNEMTKTTDRCELLNKDWCNTPVVLEPGYTYMVKSVMTSTLEYACSKRSYLFYLCGITEDIPIEVKMGAQIKVIFTTPVDAVNSYSSLLVGITFKGVNATYGIIYTKTFFEGDPLIAGERTSVVAAFETTQINLHIKGLSYNSGDIGPVTDIRRIQVVMRGDNGIIHQIAYRTAPFGN